LFLNSKSSYFAIFEILGSKRIGVTSLTFLGHVTLSVIGHLTVRFPRPFPIGGPFEPSLFSRICNGFRDVKWQVWRMTHGMTIHAKINSFILVVNGFLIMRLLYDCQ